VNPRRGGDAGSGTVLVIGLVAVAVVLAGGLALVAAGYLARSRAQTGADLAALAAAGALSAPPGVRVAPEAQAAADPCGRAREAATRNGVLLTGCDVRPDGVVAVRVRAEHPVGPADARAEAGPAWARGGG
jgi:secretion/DNA translocation related TadE-like protein